MKLIRISIRLAAVLVALTLTGCLGTQPAYPMTYVVESDIRAPELDAAIAEWANALPGIALGRVGTPTVGGSIQVVNATLAEGTAGRTAWTGDVWFVEIDLGQIAARGYNAQEVMAHELGHAMGLVHTGPGTLMCATLVCAAELVMPADVAQWDSRHSVLTTP
jgi:hypothetical protein